MHRLLHAGWLWALLAIGAPAQEPVATNVPAPVASAAVPTLAAPAPAPAAAAPNPTSPPAEASIRFQFDGMPYLVMVERFAQMAGKPLIVETNIQGTVTFNDPRPYAYPEALETLNTILSMKEVMLVETDRFLRLVPFRDLPQMPLRIFRGLDKTGDVRPGEVVTVVLELKNLDAGETAKASSPMLSSAGSIAPLARGKGLIITDRIENIRRIRQLMTEIDTSSPAQRQMKTHTLLHASGAVVTELINRTFGSATAPKRTIWNESQKKFDILPPDPEDYVTAVFDEASRTLLLFGPGERVALAEDLIQRFESQEGARGGEVKIFLPRVTRAEELARMIREAIPGVAAPGEAAATAATKARVIVDSSMNRLIVTAPLAGQLDAIENLVNRIERNNGGAAGESVSESVQVTKVVRLQLADTATVFGVLTNAFTRRAPNGEPIQRIRANLDASSKTIVITGAPGEVQHALGIVEQMENIGPSTGPRETEFLEFASSAELKRVQPLVQQLYANQVADASPALVARATFVPDVEGRRLIVTGSKEHLALIRKISEQVRGPAPASQPREFRTVTLKNVRVDAAQKTISDLVAERMSDELFRDVPKPLMLPDPANNRLLITANASQMKEIEEVIRAVDTAPERAERKIENVPLRSMTAAQVMPSLNQLLRPVLEARTDAASRPEIMADATGQNLIVSALPEDLQRIREMVRQIEGSRGESAARVFRTVKLFNRAPAEVAALAEQLYREQAKGRPEPAGGLASFVPEARGNRVIVIGSEAEAAVGEGIIRQLDPAIARTEKDETRVIRLRHGTAQELAGLVEKSVNLEEEKVKLLVDARSNSLVVSGSAAGVEAAAQIVEQLDTPPNFQPKEVRMIDLKAADARTVVPMLTDLLTETMRNSRGPAYALQSKLVADTNLNRVIATGTADELREVQSLVQQIDRAPQQTEGTRVFKLTSTTATDMAKVVTDSMVTFGPGNQPIKRVSVAADDRSNTLVVTGSRHDLQDVAIIIEKLDGGQGERRTGREVKVLELETDEPGRLLTLAQQIWNAQTQGQGLQNEVTLTLDPSGKRIIVVAPGHRIAAVEQVVRGLDQKPDGAERTLHVVELKKQAAGALMPTLTRLYEEGEKGKKTRAATIVPEASGRRLMVYGSDAQAQTVRDLVTKLESGVVTGDRETKLFEVGQPEDVTRLLPLVQQLYREQMKDRDANDPADAQILPDERAGRIIVTARPAHLAQIEAIIAKLITGKVEPRQRETRVYNLNSTTADELLASVRPIYQNEIKNHPEIVSPQAVILPDALSNRIIVSGFPNELIIIEGIIKKLDQVSEQMGNTRTYELKNAQADSVAQLLSSTLVRYNPNSGRNIPRVTVGVLPNGNTLIVSGQPADLAAASTIIERLDSSAESFNKQLKIFQIQGGNTSDFAARLKQLYTEQVRSKPEHGPADALMLPDVPTDRVIVTASEKQMPLIEKLVADLDKLAADAVRELRILPLQHNPAPILMPVLREIFSKNLGHTDLAQRLVVTQGLETNTLVAEAPKPILDRLVEFLREIDQAPFSTAGRTTTMFNFTSIEEMQRLSPMLQQLYREQLRGAELSDPADAQFVSDTQARRLIVTARTNQVARLQAILSQLRETQESAPADYQTATYDLASTTATELVETLNALYLEESKRSPALASPKALILPDAAANRLIVSGTAAQLAVLDRLVKQLDQVSTKTGGTRVFKLKTAEAGQVAAVLSTALVQFDRNTRQTLPRVSVGADTNSNSLIVVGEAKDLNAAAVIVEQLESGAERKPREMRILSVRSGRASDVALRVRQLYADRIKNDPGLGAADALIMGDPVSDRLIVTASEAQFQVIQDIVTKLDEASGVESRQLAVRTLRRTSAVTMSALISQFFGQNVQSRDPAQRLVVTPTPDDGTLILEASEEVLAKVTEFAATMEEQGDQSEMRIRSYQLTDSRASELAPTLARLFAERRPSGAGGAPPRFEADATANVLIVAAAEGQFEEIQSLIDELKATAQLANEVRTFRLVNSDAEQIAPVLASMLKAEEPRTGGPRRNQAPRDPQAVIVAAAAAVNAVVVQGPPSALQTAEQILRSLDNPELTGATVLRTVHLKKATSEAVAEAVNKALVARGPKSNLQRANVTPVLNANSLLIDGPSDSVQEVIKIIEELDQESAGGELEIRVYKLEHGKARELSSLLNSMLQSVLRENARGGGGGGARQGRRGNVTISSEERTNSLIVSATPDQFKTIERLLVTLDQNSAKTDRSVRFVLLKNARAETAATRLNLLFEGRPREERPVIEADTFANSVTIIASKADLAEAEALIAELDAVSRDESVQVRMVVVNNLPADQMARMLTNLHSQMSRTKVELVDRLPLPSDTNAPPVLDGTNVVVSVAVDRAANALLLSGPARELDAINYLVDELTFQSIGNDAEFRQFALKEADPVAVARILNDLFKPEPVRRPGRTGEAGELVQPQARMTIVPETRTRSIIVRAKPTDFLLLQSLLEQLDVQSPAAQLSHRLVRLTHADPAKVLPLVAQMVQQMGLSRPGDPVSVAADTRTRAIFVVARDSMLAEVEGLVKSLDTPAAFAEAEVALISLKNTLASQVVSILQSMLRPGTTGENTAEMRELQEQVRSLRLKTEQGEDLQLDLTRPIKLLADGAPGTRAGNRLIITSTGANIAALRGVIALMDTPALVEGVSFKIVRLQNADAATVATTLTTIFQQGKTLAAGPAGPAEPDNASGKALAGNISFTPDRRSNTLILTGKAESIALAQRLVADLDEEFKGFVTEVKLFRLNFASAVRLAPLLQSVFTESSPVPGTEGWSAQVTRLQTLLNTNAVEDPKTSFIPKSRAALSIQAEDSSNMLIVAARADIMPLIEEVIRTMDNPAATGMELVRIYPLKNTEASRLLRVLTDIYAARGSQLRPEEKPGLTVDTRTNALIVSGNERIFALVETLIAQLDREVAFEYGEFRVIPLQNADAPTVASTLQQILDTRAQQKSALGAQSPQSLKAIVLADPRRNSVIVGGASEVFELVEVLAKEMDAPGMALSGQIRLVPLQHARAATVAAALTTLFNQRYQSTANAALQRHRPIIIPDVRVNALLVSANVEDNQALDQLLQKLDQQYAEEGDIKLYNLKHARASQLAQTLEQFFRAKRTGESVGRENDRSIPVTILPDDRTNSLLVTGGKDAFEAIERMLSQLDSADVYDKMSFRVFALKNGTAAKLQASLTRLFQNRPARAAGRTPEPITVVADSWANALVVGAAVEDMPMVANLIETLDNTTLDGGVQVQVIPILKGDARSISQTVQGLYRDTVGGPVPVRVDVDERLNALVVSAGEQDLKRIAELVQKLDTDQVGRVAEIRIFPLRFAQAEELSIVLSTALSSSPSAAAAAAVISPARQSMLQFITRTPEGEELVASALKEAVLITADRRRNALVVSAPVDSMNLLARIVQSLDSESPQLAKIKVFKLQNADARQMADLLTSLFRLRQQPGLPPNQRAIQYTLVRDVEVGEPVTATIGSAEQFALTVTIDLRTNSLLVGGTDHYVGLASSIIESLDSSPANERKSEVYRLKNSQAKSVEIALRSFLDQQRQRITSVAGETLGLSAGPASAQSVGTALAGETVQQLLEREVAIVAETNSNTLLLSASPRYFDPFKALIEELDQPTAQVLIQVVLAEVTLDKNSELGVEWAVQSRKGNTQINTGTDFGVKNDLQKLGGFGTTVTGSDVSFILRAMEADGRLEVLSRPQILTADNQKATIDIGERVPIVTDSRVTEQNTTISNYRYENVGVSLTVTPRISPDGFVKMEVEPSVSQLSSSTVTVSPGVNTPIISQRKATTTVTVQSGQSVIIGGLISTSDDRRRKKVPFLGNIPYLGVLFRSSKAVGIRKELLIILTPQLLIGPEAAQAMTQDQLRRSTLMDEINRDKLERQVLDPLQPLFENRGQTNPPPKI